MTLLEYFQSRSATVTPATADYLLLMSSDGSVVKKVLRNDFFGPNGIIEVSRLPNIPASLLPAIPIALIPDTLTGKDADTLDGQHGSHFQPAATAITTENIHSQSVSSASNGAKAWVNFNGAGSIGTYMAIRKSYNVASVFKNGDGYYTVTFTNPMPDDKYVIIGTAREDDMLNFARVGLGTNDTPYNTAVATAAAFPLFTARGATSGAASPSVVCVAVFD